MNQNKVILGLSGGIDSAAAAILLKEKGMDVTALYFDVTKEGDKEARNQAEKLAAGLNLPFLYKNVWERFEQIVVEPFCQSYINGCTPMPCMICNPYIKWQVLKEAADENDARWLATGHYAGICEENGIYYATKAVNSVKDQSYMLARLGQNILSRAIFPLQNFRSKEEVKKFTKSRGLLLPENLKESQDICFISTDYKDFLADKSYSPIPGNFVDENGTVIGKHHGYSAFTVGQGKGLGMGFNKKMYVKYINPNTGDVVLCENKSLYTHEVFVTVCNFAKYGECSKIPEEYEGKEFDVKIRYAAKPSPALLQSERNKDGFAKLYFAEEQRAPAPGQYAVFYTNNKVIGCGIIA